MSERDILPTVADTISPHVNICDMILSHDAVLCFNVIFITITDKNKAVGAIYLKTVPLKLKGCSSTKFSTPVHPKSGRLSL